MSKTVEALREAQRLLADLTGGDIKQSIQRLWARAVEVEVKARAALAAAQRVAGEDDLKAQIKQLMDDNGYTANELGKAQDEIKRLRDALALSPGKDMDELCAACGEPRREHVTPGGTRHGPTTLCGVFIPREPVSPAEHQA